MFQAKRLLKIEERFATLPSERGVSLCGSDETQTIQAAPARRMSGKIVKQRVVVATVSFRAFAFRTKK